MTGVLGNGQRPCWVHELTSLSIRALRVFHSKNSVVILYTAILGGGGTDAVQKLASVPSFCGAKTSTRLFTADFLGGGGTDAAGYKPHDVCVSKLELTSIQGCTMVNDWHKMGI